MIKNLELNFYVLCVRLSKAVPKLPYLGEHSEAHPVNLCCGVFCEFLGDFWVIFGYMWEEIVFLEGLVKLREIRNIEDLVKF